MTNERARHLVYRYSSMIIFLWVLIPACSLAVLAYFDVIVLVRVAVMCTFYAAGLLALVSFGRLAPSRRESSFYLETMRAAGIAWLLCGTLYAVRLFVEDPLPPESLANAILYFIVGCVAFLALGVNLALYVGSKKDPGDSFLYWPVMRFPHSIYALLKALPDKASGKAGRNDE